MCIFTETVRNLLVWQKMVSSLKFWWLPFGLSAGVIDDVLFCLI